MSCIDQQWNPVGQCQRLALLHPYLLGLLLISQSHWLEGKYVFPGSANYVKLRRASMMWTSNLWSASQTDAHSAESITGKAISVFPHYCNNEQKWKIGLFLLANASSRRAEMGSAIRTVCGREGVGRDWEIFFYFKLKRNWSVEMKVRGKKESNISWMVRNTTRWTDLSLSFFLFIPAWFNLLSDCQQRRKKGQTLVYWFSLMSGWG